MYHYAKDTAAGGANGQGVGGTWFASPPDGSRAAVNAGSPAGAEPVERAGLSVRKDPKLGDIVVDKSGMTVYRFKKDVAWPMKPACTGACLSKWPVVVPWQRKTSKASRPRVLLPSIGLTESSDKPSAVGRSIPSPAM
ncbi:hypothetical protein [Streptomyces atratus]|uniref:hypothetical protein n=1 Tax=Streptomyces atratus TaxID=1893 RepID=UPI0030B820B0